MTSKRKTYKPTGDSDGDESSAATARLDGGWAWMVCLGSHLCHMLSLGYFASLGVFYIAWKEHFGASTTASSWLLSLPWIVASPLCPIIGVLAPRLGIRRVSMIGGVVNGLATILGSFTTDMWQLYLCGAMSGAGMAMLIPTSLIMLAQYFKNRYALAYVISLVGANVGQMIFPLLIRVCISNYGWRGAMLIIGAVQMNSVVACALYRPLKMKSGKDQLGNRDVAMEVWHNGETAGTETAPASQNGPAPNQEKSFLKHCTLLKIFTNCPLTMALLAIFLYAWGVIVNLAYLPARSKEAGWSEDQGAALLTVIAIVSMTTRLFHGWFVDRKCIGIFKLQFIVLSCCTLVTFLSPASDRYVFLVGYSALIGAFLGVATPLLIVITKKLARESEVASALSWAVALFSIASGTGSVIAGKIHDMTGDYVTTFLCAGAAFMAATLLLAIAILKRRQEKDLKPGVSQNTYSYEDVPNSGENV